MKAFSDIRTALGINRLPHQQISTNRTSLPVYSRGVTRVTIDKHKSMATILLNGDYL